MHIIAKIIVTITLLSSYIQSAHLLLALNEENLVPNQSQFSLHHTQVDPATTKKCILLSLGANSSFDASFTLSPGSQLYKGVVKCQNQRAALDI